jgi:hypothetical protein
MVSAEIFVAVSEKLCDQSGFRFRDQFPSVSHQSFKRMHRLTRDQAQFFLVINHADNDGPVIGYAEQTFVTLWLPKPSNRVESGACYFELAAGGGWLRTAEFVPKSLFRRRKSKGA